MLGVFFSAFVPLNSDHHEGPTPSFKPMTELKKAQRHFTRNRKSIVPKENTGVFSQKEPEKQKEII